MVKDIVLVIKDYLDNNWDTSNTSISYQPDTHTGWFDTQATNPQVTISTPNETAQGGGTTPFSGIDPTGAGPTQEINGFCVVNCWSDREVESGVNPKKLVHEFKEEVRRIIHDKATAHEDYRFIGFSGADFLVETETEPTGFRIEITVQFGYAVRP